MHEIPKIAFNFGQPSSTESELNQNLYASLSSILAQVDLQTETYDISLLSTQERRPWLEIEIGRVTADILLKTLQKLTKKSTELGFEIDKYYASIPQWNGLHTSVLLDNFEHHLYLSDKSEHAKFFNGLGSFYCYFKAWQVYIPFLTKHSFMRIDWHLIEKDWLPVVAVVRGEGFVEPKAYWHHLDSVRHKALAESVESTKRANTETESSRNEPECQMPKSLDQPQMSPSASLQQTHSETVRKADWFVSYNKADRQWAEWIAWQLEAAGDHVVIQEWDFRPGSNFILEMQAATSAARTIAILSPDYLASQFTQPEWAAAFAQDATGSSGKLLPVRVRDCTLEGLLRPIVYIDLVGKNDEAAKDALLKGVSRDRAKPAAQPTFPGSFATPVSNPVAFPGPSSAGMKQLLVYAKEVFGPPVREIKQSEFHSAINEKRAVIVWISSDNVSEFPTEVRKHFGDSYGDRVLLGYLHRKQIIHFDVFRRKHLDANPNIDHKGRDGYYLFIDGRLTEFHSNFLDDETSKKILSGFSEIPSQTANILMLGTAAAVALSDDPKRSVMKIGNALSKGMEAITLKSIIDHLEKHLIAAGIH